MAETLLGVSVWADMRDGTDQLDLLLTLGKRVGLTSILLATDGPLAAKTTTLPAADRSPASVPVVVKRRFSRVAEANAGTQHLATWPERDLFGEVAAGAFTSVDVAVSVGRTDAEAKARAQSDSIFSLVAGTSENALVGRLEDVQQKVARLAASGIRELYCILPRVDFIDHLAQLSSIAVGRLDTHHPGRPRSADPLPPPGWGAPARSQ